MIPLSWPPLLSFVLRPLKPLQIRDIYNICSEYSSRTVYLYSNSYSVVTTDVWKY